MENCTSPLLVETTTVLRQKFTRTTQKSKPCIFGFRSLSRDVLCPPRWNTVQAFVSTGKICRSIFFQNRKGQFQSKNKKSSSVTNFILLYTNVLSSLNYRTMRVANTLESLFLFPNLYKTRISILIDFLEDFFFPIFKIEAVK